MDRADNQVLLGALETLLDVKHSLLDTPSDAWDSAGEAFESLVGCIQDGEERTPQTCTELIWLLAMVRSKSALYKETAAQEWIEHIGATLVRKAGAYGGSISDPIRAFSKLDAKQGCLVRIDDKLSRLWYAGEGQDTEDSILDLAGYLALLDGIEKLEVT